MAQPFSAVPSIAAKATTREASFVLLTTRRRQAWCSLSPLTQILLPPTNVVQIRYYLTEGPLLLLFLEGSVLLLHLMQQYKSLQCGAVFVPVVSTNDICRLK